MDLRYWVLTNQNGRAFYLDWQTGEQLQAKLDAYREAEQKDMPMFWNGEDICGSPCSVRIDYIADLWGSTPEVREAEGDPDRALEQIRRHSIQRAKLKWGSDAEEYEK